MKQTLISILSAAIEGLGLEAPPNIEIEVPRDESHGDLSTPLALGLSRALGRPPREIAQDIASRIPPGGPLQKVEVAGPGFINFTFSPGYYQSALGEVLEGGGKALRPDVGKGRRVQVEFVSANPTGPLHVGHGRGAAVGGALAGLLQAVGYQVVREYYVNDAGLQTTLLGNSVFERYKELLGLPASFPEDGYHGDYVRDIARAFKEKNGDILTGKDIVFNQIEEKFTGFAVDMMLGVIKEDLKAFGIEIDNWQSEQELHSSGQVRKSIEALREKGFIYEHEGATWFKATEFGDDKDRVVIKGDGEHTYFASDIAYHALKADGGFDEIINIWGADHHGYVPRLEAVLDALGYGRDKLRVILVQMVSLVRGGEPVQMSKRSGDFVTLSEVMDEVGADTTKFIFLTRRPESQLTFDLEAAKAASAENPVYYVQYAGARINSIMKHAATEDIPTGADELRGADLSLLARPDEIKLIRKLLQYPMALELGALNREPHRLTFYLQELAGLFHPYYNQCRVVTEERGLTLARLALLRALKLVLTDGLGVLGLTAPDRM